MRRSFRRNDGLLSVGAFVVAILIMASAGAISRNFRNTHNEDTIISETSISETATTKETTKAATTTTKATTTKATTTKATTTKATTTKATTKSSSGDWEDDPAAVLAHVIYAEYSGTNRQHMEYVGSVVLNRVASSSFPNTIYDVVHQRGQYACVFQDRHYYIWEPSDLAWDVAYDLLKNGSVLPSGVVYQAEFIQGEVYAHIGDTYFCYE